VRSLQQLTVLTANQEGMSTEGEGEVVCERVCCLLFGKSNMLQQVDLSSFPLVAGWMNWVPRGRDPQSTLFSLFFWFCVLFCVELTVQRGDRAGGGRSRWREREGGNETGCKKWRENVVAGEGRTNTQTKRAGERRVKSLPFPPTHSHPSSVPVSHHHTRSLPPQKTHIVPVSLTLTHHQERQEPPQDPL